MVFGSIDEVEFEVGGGMVLGVVIVWGRGVWGGGVGMVG